MHSEQAKADFSRTKRIARAGDHEKSQNAYPDQRYLSRNIDAVRIIIFGYLRIFFVILPIC